MNRCKNCGTEYDVTDTFCKSCGQKLEKEDSIEEKKQKLKDKGVILLTVFLPFVFLLYALLTHKSDPYGMDGFAILIFLGGELLLGAILLVMSFEWVSLYSEVYADSPKRYLPRTIFKIFLVLLAIVMVIGFVLIYFK